LLPSPFAFPAHVLKSIDFKSAPAEVTKQLKTIRAGFLEGKEYITDYRVTGRVLPGDRKFTSVYYDDMTRVDLEYVDNAGERFTLFRVDDGNVLLKLDGRGLTIASLANRIASWRAVTGELSKYEAPVFEGEQLDVGERCQWFIDMIENSGQFEGLDFLKNDDNTLSINELDNGLLQIDFASKSSEDGKSFSKFSLKIIVAPSQGYNLISHEDSFVAADPEQWAYEYSIHNEYKDLADNIYFLSHGSCDRKESGRATLDRGGPNTSHSEVVIDSIEFGNLAVEDEYFNISALPIEVGTAIEDHRLDPPATFIYGKSDVKNDILERSALALEGSATQQSTEARSYLMALNIAVVLVLGTLCAYSYFSKKST
jgi:hypothetical protein